MYTRFYEKFSFEPRKNFKTVFSVLIRQYQNSFVFKFKFTWTSCTYKCLFCGSFIAFQPYNNSWFLSSSNDKCTRHR